MTSPVLATTWVSICGDGELQAERGAVALVGEAQVAVFRTFAGDLFAIDNRDPFTGAFVLSRGIVGSRGDIPTVASPLHKQVFDLRTGVCLDVPGVAVPIHAVRAREGVIEVLSG
jgi:nitrite reductase (NADH) small subunit